MDVLPAGRRGSPPRAALPLRIRRGVAAGEVGGAPSSAARNTWLLHVLVHALFGSAVGLLTAVPAARSPLTRTASELVRDRVACP